MYRFFIPYTNSSEHWFSDCMKDGGLETVSYGNPYAGEWNMRSIFRYAWYALRKMKREDVAVFWNPESAIALAVINLFLHRHNRIIALHSFFPDEPVKFRIIWKTLFFFANRYPHITYTVNTAEEIVLYHKLYGIPAEGIHIVPDCVEPELLRYDIQTFTQGQGYVFSGGRSWRDWETLVTAASKTPDIRYIVVADKDALANHAIPSNMAVMHDVPYGEYLSLIRNSDVVVVPLRKTIACGLLLLVQAAVMHKAVVATDTPCTRIYINDDTSGKLAAMHDADALAHAVDLLYRSVEKQKCYADTLHEQVETFSAEKYFNKTKDLIR